MLRGGGGQEEEVGGVSNWEETSISQMVTMVIMTSLAIQIVTMVMLAGLVIQCFLHNIVLKGENLGFVSKIRKLSQYRCSDSLSVFLMMTVVSTKVPLLIMMRTTR